MEEGYITPAPDYNAPDPVPQAPEPEPAPTQVPPAAKPEPQPEAKPERQPEQPAPEPKPQPQAQQPQPAPRPQPTPQPSAQQPQPAPQAPLPVPPHSNMMVWSVLITLFCCLIGGIIAIIQSSKANDLYNSCLFTQDPGLRQSLYLQSEAKNKSARTWIWISVLTGLIPYLCLLVVFLVAGAEAFADL